MTKAEKQEQEIPEAIKQQAEEAVNQNQNSTAELEAKISELKEALMRAMADAENTRKRSQKEVEEANKYGTASFAKDLLNVSENLQRALDSVPAESKTLFEGVELTKKELLSVFERRGIKRIEPKAGEKFDHNVHQAIAQVEDPKFEQGAIIQVVQAGYVIHDRLLRPAMVTVSKGVVNNQASPKVDTSA
jgi:molecular chaperone GrpE